MSAPSSSGRWSAGDAKVLSTTTSGGAWPACAARSRMVAADARDVGDLEQRVRRRLEPHEARPGGQALPQGVLARREVDVARRPAARGPVHALEVAVRAAVDVVADDDLVARRRRAGRSPRSSPIRSRRRCRGGRPRGPPPRARAARGSGSGCGRTRSRGAAARRRPGRTSRSGRSAARRRRWPRRARRRRGPRGWRRRRAVSDRADRRRAWPSSYRREIKVGGACTNKASPDAARSASATWSGHRPAPPGAHRGPDRCVRPPPPAAIAMASRAIARGATARRPTTSAASLRTTNHGRRMASRPPGSAGWRERSSDRLRGGVPGATRTA